MVKDDDLIMQEYGYGGTIDNFIMLVLRKSLFCVNSMECEKGERRATGCIYERIKTRKPDQGLIRAQCLVLWQPGFKLTECDGVGMCQHQI